MGKLDIIRFYEAKTIKDNNYVIVTKKKIEKESHKNLSTLDDSMYLRAYKRIKGKNAYPKPGYIIDFIQVAFDKNEKKIRKKLYEDGFIVDNIHYVRDKRTAGSARTGKCLFVNEKYVAALEKWSLCGLDDKDQRVLDNKVSFESYKALTLSGIKDTIRIERKNIFLLKEDCIAEFVEKVNSVKINESGSLDCEEDEKAKISNNIWDGEGLLDESLFLSAGYHDKGMLLLRNKFFKCCCFNTKLQKWFKDKNVKIGDLNEIGETATNDITDIQLVCTPSSLKYLKFGDFFQWLDNYEPEFGIVKYDTKTPFFNGEMVKTSYTMLNTFDLTKEQVQSLYEYPLDYVQKVHDDIDVFFYNMHRRNAMIKEDSSTTAFRFRLMMEILDKYPELYNNELFRDERQNVTDSIRKEYAAGKVLIPGHYATIMGNGPELLMRLSGEFNPKYYNEKNQNHTNRKSVLQKGEVYCTGFEENEKLVAVRFPHITMGNIFCAKNTYHKEFDYFNLTDEIICVNAIDENIQQRLNGMDYDSDTMLVTDMDMIVKAVEKHYDKFLVPFNKEESNEHTKKSLDYTIDELDSMIHSAHVGSVVNFATILNSIFWDKLHKDNIFDKDLYKEICKLAVLSGMEIDKAKHNYNINAGAVMKEVRDSLKAKNYCIRKPAFRYTPTVRKKGYKDFAPPVPMDTTMDYVVDWVDKNTLNRPREYKMTFSGFVGRELPDQPGEFYESSRNAVEIIKQAAKDIMELHSKQFKKDKDELGVLNRQKNEILEEARKKITTYLKTEKKVIFFLRMIDEWTKKGLDRESKNSGKGIYVNMAWITLDFLWRDEPHKDNNSLGGWLKRFLKYEEKSSYSSGLVLDPAGDVTLYDYTFMREADPISPQDYDMPLFEEELIYDDELEELYL